VHHHGAANAAQRLGDQDEALGGAGGEQHLVRVTAVSGGDRRAGRRRVRIPGQVGQGRGDRVGQPGGRPRPTDVDGEVDQAGGRLRVAVVGEVRLDPGGWGDSARLIRHVRDPAGKVAGGTVDLSVSRVTTRRFKSFSHVRIGNVIT
jgi:hypothetical protein